LKVGARRAEPDGAPSERAFQSAANDMPDYEAAARFSRRPFDPCRRDVRGEGGEAEAPRRRSEKDKGGDVAV
jgi:hypothetical protein